MSEENKNTVEQEKEESYIDFRKLFKDILKHKWLYIIVMVVTFVVVAIFSFTPKQETNALVRESRSSSRRVAAPRKAR